MALAYSDTYPETLGPSRGKTLYRYNVREEQITDPMTGATRTQFVYDEVEIEGKVTKAKILAAMRAADSEADTGDIGEAAADYRDAKTAIELAELAKLTYAELDQHIDDNVTDLAAARTFLKRLSKVVLAMLKSGTSA